MKTQTIQMPWGKLTRHLRQRWTRAHVSSLLTHTHLPSPSPIAVLIPNSSKKPKKRIETRERELQKRAKAKAKHPILKAAIISFSSSLYILSLYLLSTSSQTSTFTIKRCVAIVAMAIATATDKSGLAHSGRERPRAITGRKKKKVRNQVRRGWALRRGCVCARRRAILVLSGAGSTTICTSGVGKL